MDRLRRLAAEEEANADKWVCGLSEATLRRLNEDIAADRTDINRYDPLARWKIAKRAAVRRALAIIYQNQKP